MPAAAERAFGGLDDLLAGLVRGDLQMRRDSLQAPGTLPTLLVATAVRAQLHFMAETRSRQGFRWSRETEAGPVAEVTLDLRLAKARKPAPAVIGEPEMDLAAPDFLAVPSIPPDTLVLRTAPGELLEVGLPDGGRSLRLPGAADLPVGGVSSRAMGDDGPGDYTGDYLNAWPVGVLVRTIGMLADWRRRGEPRVAGPFRIPADRGALGRVLGQIRGTWREIAEILDGDPPDPDGGLARLRQELAEASPQLAGALVLDAARLAVTLYVNDHGELAQTRGNPHLQRLDLAAELVPGPEGQRLRLGLGLTDTLVEGPLHRRFLDGLRSDDVAERMVGEMRTPSFPFGDPVVSDGSQPPQLKAKQLAAYLRHSAHDAGAAFVRMRHDDTDLVLLERAPDSLPLDMMWQVPFTESGAPAPGFGRGRDLKLLAWRWQGGGWKPGTGQNLAPRYFYRLYRTLQAWQAGMVPSPS